MKGITWLAIIYCLLLVGDVVSTLINGSLVEFLEVNALYSTIGIMGIVFLNMVILGLFYYGYVNLGVNWRWIITLVLVSICVIRGIAIIGNIAVFLNPPTLQAAMSFTVAQKQAVAYKFVLSGLLFYLPGAFAWMFYSKDHIIRKVR